MWVGTTAGLCKFDRLTGTFRRYSRHDGLADDNVLQIAPDAHGSIWVSTETGLSRIDPHSGRVRTYGPADGLAEFSFNFGTYNTPRDSVLYFAGNSGLLMFRPGDIQDPAAPAPVVLTGFRVFNTPTPFSDFAFSLKRIDLSFLENSFSFDFAALDFSDPARTRYAYRLDGFDEDWIHAADRRFAAYTNLPPGEYTFRVKGASSTGAWNNEGASVHLVISPPFWATWWFRISSGVLLAAVSGGLVLNRSRSKRQREQMREEMSRRLIESQEMERKRIAAGLHDSLGQNLLVLKNTLQQAADDHQLPSGTRQEIVQLVHLAQQSLDEVREISFDLHPHVLDRLGLKRAIETMIEKVTVLSSIEFTLELTPLPVTLRADAQINLFRIAQEAISNVVKHSFATSAVIHLIVKDSELELLVKDNGKGFDVNAHVTRPPETWSLGLLNIAERVRLLGGTYSIASSPGSGTTLTIAIPLERKRNGT
jgi:signal transduction histidine kinase